MFLDYEYSLYNIRPIVEFVSIYRGFFSFNTSERKIFPSNFSEMPYLMCEYLLVSALYICHIKCDKCLKSNLLL